MIAIQIDTSSLTDSFDLSQADINDLMDYTVKEMTYRFAREWEQEAVSILKNSRQEYINHLTVVDDGFAKGSVVLTGVLPNMVEQGADGFDIKIGLLNSPKAKTGKDGSKYITVPFKHGIPGSLQENFSGGVMPSEVHDIVKKKKVDSVSGKSKGLVKDELPKAFQEPQKKSLSENRSYTHKNAIYEGLRKSKDSAGNTSYESFRRVSGNSAPESWGHPGIDAANLAEKTLQSFDVPRQTGKIIDEWLRQRG